MIFNREIILINPTRKNILKYLGDSYFNRVSAYNSVAGIYIVKLPKKDSFEIVDSMYFNNIRQLYQAEIVFLREVIFEKYT